VDGTHTVGVDVDAVKNERGVKDLEQSPETDRSAAVRSCREERPCPSQRSLDGACRESLSGRRCATAPGAPGPGFHSSCSSREKPRLAWD
jgi:hypothetical protein